MAAAVSTGNQWRQPGCQATMYQDTLRAQQRKYMKTKLTQRKQNCLVDCCKNSLKFFFFSFLQTCQDRQQVMMFWLLKLNLEKNLAEHIAYVLEMFPSGKEAIDSILIFQREANHERGLVPPYRLSSRFKWTNPICNCNLAKLSFPSWYEGQHDLPTATPLKQQHVYHSANSVSNYCSCFSSVVFKRSLE